MTRTERYRAPYTIQHGRLTYYRHTRFAVWRLVLGLFARDIWRDWWTR